MIGVAFGILSFLHKDISDVVAGWIAELGMDLENPRVVALLARLDLITDHQLGQWSVVTFCFSGMFLTEGVGLLLRREWAKYLTIIGTATFVPFELYAVIDHFSALKLGLLAGNLAVVVLLGIQLRKEAMQQRQALGPITIRQTVNRRSRIVAS